MMKKIIVLLSALLVACCLDSNAKETVFHEGTEFTLVGNLFPDTPNPYHRIDTVKYKGFNKSENNQVRESAGMSIAFDTDSPEISVTIDYGQVVFPNNATGITARGVDLYIKKDGEWLWAASSEVYASGEKPSVLIRDMNTQMKSCLLYLPLFSEVRSIKIGVPEGCTIKAGEMPFRHRVAIFGSSFTHGSSTSRPGMAYPAQFSRMTGIQLLSLGCSGNCKLQPYFANALKDVDCDAYIFDSFSNPTIEIIDENLFPFIETIQSAKPGVPLIFQKTIYRERRNFNESVARKEEERIAFVDSVMAIACKKYKDVYYITETNATSKRHETSVDGTHPGDYGYTLWAESITKPVLRILKKYGIQNSF